MYAVKVKPQSQRLFVSILKDGKLMEQFDNILCNTLAEIKQLVKLANAGLELPVDESE